MSECQTAIPLSIPPDAVLRAFAITEASSGELGEALDWSLPYALLNPYRLLELLNHVTVLRLSAKQQHCTVLHCTAALHWRTALGTALGTVLGTALGNVLGTAEGFSKSDCQPAWICLWGEPSSLSDFSGISSHILCHIAPYNVTNMRNIFPLL